MPADDSVGCMDDIPCDCPVCRVEEPPSPDEVIIGLTVAMLRRDWEMVATVAQTLQDKYGTMSDDDVLTIAQGEVTRRALVTIAHGAVPIEA